MDSDFHNRQPSDRPEWTPAGAAESTESAESAGSAAAPESTANAENAWNAGSAPGPESTGNPANPDIAGTPASGDSPAAFDHVNEYQPAWPNSPYAPPRYSEPYPNTNPYAPNYPTASYTPGSYSAPAGWTDLEPVRPRGNRRTGLFAGLAGVALLAAVVGSGATVGALAATGYIGKPAVVAPVGTTSGTANSATDLSSVPQSDTAAAAARVSPAVVTIEIGSGGQQTGAGSGIVFDSNGWILTNRHVAQAGSGFTVDFPDGRRLPATVYGTDTLTDLAVLKVDATGLKAATIGSSSNIQVGEPVIAIGDPLGTYPGSVTSGIVSGLNRAITAGSQGSSSTENLSDLIQTDAAINPGNSGGPLADLNGRVIGINTAGSSQAQGMGFAIPIDLAKPLMQQALAGQKLARAWLGVRYVDLDANVAAQNNLSVTTGAWVTGDQQTGQPGVLSGSPAAQAGLRDNDIITAIDGTKIDQAHPFIELMSSHAPGSKVALTVLRDGSTVNLTVTLSTRPDSAQ